MELNGDKTTTSIMDWEFIETKKRGRALLSGGHQYLRIRKGIEGWSLGDVVSMHILLAIVTVSLVRILFSYRWCLQIFQRNKCRPQIVASLK